MDIATNTHNLSKRIDYALANLSMNAPELGEQMRWCFTNISMSNRLRRCAGVCKYWRKTDEARVEFSEKLFNSISEMEKTDTVVHELAHVVCMRLNLDRGHGYQFKRVARAMGGSGNRCIALKPGVVKRNLVKRWVMTRKGNPEKLYLRTRKQADNFTVVYRDALLLGVTQIDQNTKSVKWLSVCAEQIRTVNPLGDKFTLVP